MSFHGAPGENRLLLSSVSGGCGFALAGGPGGRITPLAACVGALLSPLCVSHLPLMRTLVVVFRAHPGNPGSSPHLEDPVTPVNLVIAAKALSR